MNTRPLIITSDQLLAMADVPADAKVVTAGPSTGSGRGEIGGVYARISSESFKPEDQDKPLEMKAK